MMRLHLLGRHAHRIPLAYPAYRTLARNIDLVPNPDDADFIVFGFMIDIKDHVEAILQAQRRNPGVMLVVLSEEPLWDTLWTPSYHKRVQTVDVGGQSMPLFLLNHFTTSIFDFDRFPYFLTTDDHYFARYQALFSRNTALSEQQWLDHWARAPVLAAFVAEHRLGEKYAFRAPARDTFGLCDFRTRVALGVTETSTIRIGQGWAGAIQRRQALPDWHLDKLSALDGRVRCVSGLENTHCPAYLTEKLFDSYATRGIPLYFASPAHRAHSIVTAASFINLYGRDPDVVGQEICAFVPDIVYAEAYRQAQAHLHALFKLADEFIGERLRVIREILSELERLADQR